MIVKDGFALFWKERDYMSNWHKSPFVINGITFNCAEQYLMYSKAMMFDDKYIADKVLESVHPREQKALGRKVRNFDNAKWEEQRSEVLYEACLAKFQQNEDLKKKLLDTKGLHLAEASPYDTIFGIGLDEEHPYATNPAKWNGLNLLGKVLMRVRKTLMV